MKTGPQSLLLPEAAPAPLISEVRRFGNKNLETGGFFLAAAADPMRVTTVAFAGDVGITRRPGMFRVSGKAIDRLFGWADAQGLRIPAQFHSHRSDAFLSRTDRTEGFNVTDFVSAVVPHFDAPPMDPGSWRWWTYSGEAWRPLPPPQLTDGLVMVVAFDELGVRVHE